MTIDERMGQFARWAESATIEEEATIMRTNEHDAGDEMTAEDM